MRCLGRRGSNPAIGSGSGATHARKRPGRWYGATSGTPTENRPTCSRLAMGMMRIRGLLSIAIWRWREDRRSLVWGSPPCQEHTSLRAVTHRIGPVPETHRDILAPVRAKLIAWGGPWIMENVVGAPLFYSAQLCGVSFRLRVYRHRRFEAPFMLLAPPHIRHPLP